MGNNSSDTKYGLDSRDPQQQLFLPPDVNDEKVVDGTHLIAYYTNNTSDTKYGLELRDPQQQLFLPPDVNDEKVNRTHLIAYYTNDIRPENKNLAISLSGAIQELQNVDRTFLDDVLMINVITLDCKLKLVVQSEKICLRFLKYVQYICRNQKETILNSAELTKVFLYYCFAAKLFSSVIDLVKNSRATLHEDIRKHIREGIRSFVAPAILAYGWTRNSILVDEQRKQCFVIINALRPKTSKCEGIPPLTLKNLFQSVPMGDNLNPEDSFQFSSYEDFYGYKRAYLACDDGGRCLITFTGTNAWTVWETNCTCCGFVPLEESGNGATCHRGIFEMYKDLHGKMRGHFLNLFSPNNTEVKEILIGGHSLGGALAQLCAFHIAKFNRNICITVATLGAPKIFNIPAEFPENVSVHNFYDKNDPVVTIPTFCMGLTGVEDEKNWELTTEYTNNCCQILERHNKNKAYGYFLNLFQENSNDDLNVVDNSSNCMGRS